MLNRIVLPIPPKEGITVSNFYYKSFYNTPSSSNTFYYVYIDHFLLFSEIEITLEFNWKNNKNHALKIKSLQK